jgi:imidazole glycerol-phosphate synthase subunit HisH
MSAAASGGPVEIGIVDYGMGNRRSVEKALEHVGARPLVSSDPDVLTHAAGLVLPGVGAFPRAMENLKRLGLAQLLVDRVGAGAPVLGICLGMQLAFDGSEELGGADGLGIVAGTVTSLQTDGLKLPHIGWNEVTFAQTGSPLLTELPERCAFYHVHSYAPQPADAADVLGTAVYGQEFVTAVRHGSFHGVQFHPEKSSVAGLRMLGNFARICAGTGERAGAGMPSAAS